MNNKFVFLFFWIHGNHSIQILRFSARVEERNLLFVDRILEYLEMIYREQ